MSEQTKLMLQQVLDRLDAIERKQPARVNGRVGFMAEKLKLNIGSVIAVGIVVISCTTWISVQVSAIKQSWTVDQQRLWTERTRKLNSGAINYADVDQVRRDQP